MEKTNIPLSEFDEEEEKIKFREKYNGRWIKRNLYIIAAVFVFNFLAYNGLGTLQSSLHREEGLGTISQSVVYFCLIWSNLLLPRFFIAKLGQKWSICVCICGYMTWMAANGYAVFWTMIPTAAIVGICAGPLWCSMNSYVTRLGRLQAEIDNKKTDQTITRFFGIFFGLFNISSIISSIINTTILRAKPVNGTDGPSDDDLSRCGAQDCPWSNSTNINLEKPEPNVVWTLVGVYLGLAGCGLCLAVFQLDEIPDELQDGINADKAWEETKELLVATFKMNKSPIMWLLIQRNIWSSLYFALFYADWPRSYITCAVGIMWVGIITIPQAILQAPFTYLGGIMNKYTGRIPPITIGVSIELAILLIMLFWSPNPDQLYVFFIVSVISGIGGGLQGPQMNGLVGTYYRDTTDAAYANLAMWGGIGSTTGFAYSNAVCNYIKIYLVFSMEVFALVCYFLAEYLVAKDPQYHLDIATDVGEGIEKNGVQIVDYRDQNKSSSTTRVNEK